MDTKTNTTQSLEGEIPQPKTQEAKMPKRSVDEPMPLSFQTEALRTSEKEVKDKLLRRSKQSGAGEKRIACFLENSYDEALRAIKHRKTFFKGKQITTIREGPAAIKLPSQMKKSQISQIKTEEVETPKSTKEVKENIPRRPSSRASGPMMEEKQVDLTDIFDASNQKINMVENKILLSGAGKRRMSRFLKEGFSYHQARNMAMAPTTRKLMLKRTEREAPSPIKLPSQWKKPQSKTQESTKPPSAHKESSRTSEEQLKNKFLISPRSSGFSLKEHQIDLACSLDAPFENTSSMSNRLSGAARKRMAWWLKQGLSKDEARKKALVPMNYSLHEYQH